MKEKFLFLISIVCWATLIVSAFDNTMTSTAAGKYLIISLFGGGLTFYFSGIMSHYKRIDEKIKENRSLIAFGFSAMILIVPIYLAINS